MWLRTTARTFITAIAKVIDVRAAVASTKAWVLGSRFTSRRSRTWRTAARVTSWRLAQSSAIPRPRLLLLGGFDETQLCRRAALLARGCVLSRAHSFCYGHSLRPCLGTSIAPRRRATFRQNLLK